MFYIIIFYIFMLSKIFLASTTSNSMQSSWEDLGQFEEFDNIDDIEVKIIQEGQSKKKAPKISVIDYSKKLITEIRNIYFENNDLLNEKLKNENDDDCSPKFLSEEEKLSAISANARKAEFFLHRLQNILRSPKNISCIDQEPEKENTSSSKDNSLLSQEKIIYDILIRAEQINTNIINLYGTKMIQASSSKSSLSTSPNINKNNLTSEKNSNKYKAQVRTYFTLLESSPQENNSLGCSQNNIVISRPTNTTPCFNLPPERKNTAIFRNLQQPSPCLHSRYLSCESIDEKIVIMNQTNNDNNRNNKSNNNSDNESDD